MNYKVELIKEMLATGELQAFGDLVAGGQVIYDFQEPESGDPAPAGPVTDQWGFYGQPDEHHCFRNVHAELVVQKYSSSKDPAERKAAKDAPQLFMFVQTAEQLKKMSAEMRATYYHNHHRGLMMRSVFQLVDLGYNTIPGRWFLQLGNANFPGHRDGVDIPGLIVDYMEFWLDDRADQYSRERDPINNP